MAQQAHERKGYHEDDLKKELLAREEVLSKPNPTFTDYVKTLRRNELDRLRREHPTLPDSDVKELAKCFKVLGDGLFVLIDD